VRLIGGKSSPACASYALRKVADVIEIHSSSDTVLRVKKIIDVDDCLISENRVEEAAQAVNELHCFCDPSAFTIFTWFVCLQYTVPLCLKDLVWPRRFEFCAVTIAFKVSRLVARSVTKELELRTIWEIMARSVKRLYTTYGAAVATATN